MSKLFTCDNCGKTFGQALDTELHKDVHGVLTEYDLCAPCRKQLNDTVSKPKDDFFEAIKVKKVK